MLQAKCFSFCCRTVHLPNAECIHTEFPLELWGGWPKGSSLSTLRFYCAYWKQVARAYSKEFCHGLCKYTQLSRNPMGKARSGFTPIPLRRVLPVVGTHTGFLILQTHEKSVGGMSMHVLTVMSNTPFLISRLPLLMLVYSCFHKQSLSSKNSGIIGSNRKLLGILWLVCNLNLWQKSDALWLLSGNRSSRILNLCFHFPDHISIVLPTQHSPLHYK